MDYNVLGYGAAGDGVTKDTAAIQAAIDDCHRKGGGRVVLDGARTYLSGSLRMGGNVELRVERGSVLKASPDLADYIRPNEGAKDTGVDRVGTPVTLKPSYAFIYAKGADRMAISGEGVIDGNCYAFVKRVSQYYVTGDFYPRPTMIYVEDSDHITFREITLRDSPFWTLHPAGCDDVLVQGIRILNPLDVANSDGIDPDHSRNVRILGCHVECADDAICLKSSAGNMEYGPTEDIIIADCTLVSTSAALKIGTEGTGDFRHVLVHDCAISSSNRGISVQIRDGGNVSDVTFSNIKIETRRFADCWWGAAEPIAVSSLDRDENTTSGTISDILFENISCVGENGVVVNSPVPGRVRGITFRNVRVDLRTTSKWEKGRYDFRPGLGAGIEEMKSGAFLLRGAEDVELTDCRARLLDNDCGKFGEALVQENCRNVEITRFRGW